MAVTEMQCSVTGVCEGTAANRACSMNTGSSMHHPCLLMLLPPPWPDILVYDFLHSSPIAYFSSGALKPTLQASFPI